MTETIPPPQPVAAKPTPMDILSKMLEGEVAQGLAEAKAFEKFVRLALNDIMKHVLEIERRLTPIGTVKVTT